MSEVSKALLVQYSMVSGSGPLNSLYLKGKEYVLHFTYRAGAPGARFFIFKLEFPTVLIILPLFQLFFVFFMLLKTALSHSHIGGLYGKKKGMVSRCECVFLP